MFALLLWQLTNSNYIQTRNVWSFALTVSTNVALHLRTSAKFINKLNSTILDNPHMLERENKNYSESLKNICLFSAIISMLKI